MKKKIWYFISLFFLCPFVVYGMYNTLYLKEFDKQLYYDEKYCDEFVQEIKVSESKTYSYEITIHNESTRKDELFVLLESTGEDGSYDDVMDYLNLKLTLDDKVIFEGSAEGVDYASKREDLHDFISVGSLVPKGDSKLKMEFSLSSNYQSFSDNSFAYLKWEFYLKDKDGDYLEVQKLSPKVLYNFLDVWIFCGVCVLFAVLLLSIYLYRNRKKYKDKPKKEKKKKKKGEEETEKEEK